MTITQREMDMAQLEAELKMQELFDRWRKAFLAERFLQQSQQSGANPPSIPEEIEGGDIR